MRSYIEFPLEEGGSLLVEVCDQEGAEGTMKAARGEGIIKAQQTFEAALEKIKPAATAIISKLRDLTDAPDEVEVQFGLKMSSAAGAIVASASVEANYLVTLKWKSQETKGFIHSRRGDGTRSRIRSRS